MLTEDAAPEPRKRQTRGLWLLVSPALLLALPCGPRDLITVPVAATS